MSEERMNENPEAEGESSPYLDLLRGADTHEADLQRMIRDRGRMVGMLFFLLVGAVYGNAYQLTLPKNVPYIHNVSEHGEVVTRILRRPEEVPPEDPHKQSFIRNRIKGYIENARVRTVDTSLMVRGINSALRESAGPARIKLSTEVQKEDLAQRIKRETVEVVLSKPPVPLAGNTWQAEWEEIVRAPNNTELRRETWTGSFQLAEQSNWVTEWNAYGVQVVDRNWTRINR